MAPEHVSGGFGLFVQGHSLFGNQARYVTFYRSAFGFKEDICFDLWGMPSAKWVRALKNLLKIGDQAKIELQETLPFRPPLNPFEKTVFGFRDFINAPFIEGIISEYKLDDYDIYHFEQGADPYRDGRWVRRLAAAGKSIVCFYHGTDVRNRGIFDEVHRHSKLNLTCEIDLLPKIPGMKYLYLPIDEEAIKPTPRQADGRIRIAHAARNRRNKGSDIIERVVRELAKSYPIDWVMIENLPHAEAMNLKSSSDIFIDQITDIGGWGYGASSVEALAMGLPTVSRINRNVEEFLGNHPFVSADAESLRHALIPIIEDEAYRLELGRKGREWVIERHGLKSVMTVLYGYYQQNGLM